MMKIEIEIIQFGEKLPTMVVENVNSNQVLPLIKNIVTGAIKDNTNK